MFGSTRHRHIETAGEAASAGAPGGINGSGQIHGRQRAPSCPPMDSSYWPRMGIFMAACGQFFMSADRTRVRQHADLKRNHLQIPS